MMNKNSAPLHYSGFLGLAFLLFLTGSATAQITGTFRNATDQAVQVYWVGSDNANNLYNNLEIPAGGSAAFSAHPGTRWRFYHGQELIEEYTTTEANNQVVSIGGMKVAPPPPRPPADPPPPNRPSSDENPVSLRQVTFTNKTPMTLDVYLWDDLIERDFLYENMEPGASVELSTYPDNFWSFAAGNIRIETYTATSEGTQQFEVKAPSSKASFHNRRLMEVDLYAILPGSEKYELLTSLSPGLSVSLNLLAGTTIAMSEDGTIIGSATVVPEESQEFEILPDKIAAEEAPAVRAVFLNNSGRDLAVYLEDPDKNSLEFWEHLPAGQNLEIMAEPLTRWVIVNGTDEIGSFEVTPVPYVEFEINPEDL